MKVYNAEMKQRELRADSSETLYERLLFLCPAVVTLTVSPWMSLDPINPIKMLFLSAISFAGIPYIFVNRIVILRQGLIFVGITFVWLVAFVVTTIYSSVGILNSLWGTWGRSTGSLTYFSYVLLMLSYTIYIYKHGARGLLRSMTLTNYIVCGYVVIQHAGLDPIPWSQMLPVATLGNINFVSAFMGMCSVLFCSYFMDSKVSLTARIHYLVLIAINLALIWISQSIQGIAIFAVGLTVLVALQMRKRKVTSSLFFLISVLSGVLIFAGAAGLGPLKNVLVQETILYRIDYWKAGLYMFFAKPLTGFGPDAYGEYYRQFRDDLAISRTGPQRVTNTAHNVFLDLLSGSGAFAGLALGLFILLACVRILKFGLISESSSIFLALICSWFTFLLISIGQIGVMVWGFALLGAGFGMTTRSFVSASNSQRHRNKKFKKTPDSKSSRLLSKEPTKNLVENSSLSRGFLTLSFFFFGAAFAIPPTYADAKIFDALRSKDLYSLSTASELTGASSYHKELLVEQFAQAGRKEEALQLARELVRDEPRSWRGWVEIALSDASKIDEKVTAYNTLISLDPRNGEIKRGLDLIRSGLGIDTTRK